MTRLAIVSAMAEEIGLLHEHMPNAQCVRRAGREFWLGDLWGTPAVAVRSGIGKVAAATTAALLFTEFNAHSLIFTGVAGGLGPGVRVGDMVVADALLQHDMDASPMFPRFEVPLYGRARFPADAGLSDALAQAATAALSGALDWARTGVSPGPDSPRPQVWRGLIVSGDQFINNTAQCQTLCQDIPGVLAVEMEGAAVAQVCADFGHPFAVLRTISDRADDTAHGNFADFIEHRARRYTEAVMERLLLGPLFAAQ